MNNARIDPHLRRSQILKAAVRLAKSKGFNNLVRDEIAAEANVSMGLVTYYFNTMTQLKRDVMRYAIAHDEYKIVAQGLSTGDKHARKAPQETKDKAAQLLATY